MLSKSPKNSRANGTLPPVCPCSTFLTYCCFPPTVLPNDPAAFSLDISTKTSPVMTQPEWKVLFLGRERRREEICSELLFPSRDTTNNSFYVTQTGPGLKDTFLRTCRDNHVIPSLAHGLQVNKWTTKSEILHVLLPYCSRLKGVYIIMSQTANI